MRQNSRIQKDNDPPTDIIDVFNKNRNMTFEEINKLNSNQGKKVSIKLSDILGISDEEDSEDEGLNNFKNKKSNRKIINKYVDVGKSHSSLDTYGVVPVDIM